MKVSVIIPSFGRSQLLEKCVRSLTGQHFPSGDYEIIVVIDGPDASSREMLSKYGAAVKSIVHAKQRGPAAARNTGWRAAQGTLVVFTDDDCIAGAGFIEAYWNAYQKTGRTLCAFTGKVIVPVYECPTDYEKNISQLQTCAFITANCSCTKAALEKTGGFDERYKMAWREDSDLHFTLLLHHIDIIAINDAVVVHPVRECGWGVSIKEQKKSRYNALLYKKFPAQYRRWIAGGPLALYYGIILFFALFLFSFAFHNHAAAIIAMTGWLLLTLVFIMKRLNGTSKKPSHVAEMIITSLIIPFLSVFWTLRGALEFKVFFL